MGAYEVGGAERSFDASASSEAGSARSAKRRAAGGTIEWPFRCRKKRRAGWRR